FRRERGRMSVSVDTLIAEWERARKVAYTPAKAAGDALAARLAEERQRAERAKTALRETLEVVDDLMAAYVNRWPFKQEDYDDWDAERSEASRVLAASQGEPG
ncbi:MAG: hypothetical protein ACYC9L_05415, partial [Sulfuricaulis sp.]